MDVLFTIAVARITQQIGLAITQFYEQHGSDFDIANAALSIDKSHESYKNAAKVPAALYQEKCTKYGLMSLGNVEENTTVT